MERKDWGEKVDGKGLDKFGQRRIRGVTAGKKAHPEEAD